MLTREDLAAYSTIVREPVRVRYRDREVLTNPPPNAGGILLAYALALLERTAGPPGAAQLADVMRRAQHERTPEFVAGLPEPDFSGQFLASRLGSTTHISVLDADGWACSVTCTNGEGSGQVVPGTGIHLNNMMGEQDLNPYGFFTFPPGRRLPSMMAPTLVLRDGEPELVVGSAGSNRIRAAILQVIVGVVDRGLDAAAPSRRRACTGRTRSSTWSRAWTSRRSRRRATRWPGSGRRTCSSGACRWSSATWSRARSRGPGTRGGVERRWRRDPRHFVTRRPSGPGLVGASSLCVRGRCVT